MFENNGHINVYSPRAGADTPLGSKLFHKLNFTINLAISCKFVPLNSLVTVSPIQMHMRLNLTLPLSRSRLTKGHQLYIVH